MIISRTPLRLSFCGGGSDLPEYYTSGGTVTEGAVLTTAINKYTYITINRRFDHTLRLSYSKTEICDNPSQVQHPIMKCVVSDYAPEGGLEIVSIADVPSGTGLGSSSSFTVGLLHAMHGFYGRHRSADALADEACKIEIERLNEPIGKQDQYIAAHGGLQFVRFKPDGTVFVDPVITSKEKLNALQTWSMMFYTGQTRDAKTVLSEQKFNTSSKKDVLSSMVNLAYRMKDILEKDGRLEQFGSYLNEAWNLKKAMASNVSNSKIDEWYGRALEAGAAGGKILGAGGGGFLFLFCHPDKQTRVIQALNGLKTFSFQFEKQGSKIIFME